MARLESPCLLPEDGFQGKLIKKQARELDGPLGLSFPLKKPPLANLGGGVFLVLLFLEGCLLQLSSPSLKKSMSHSFIGLLVYNSVPNH